MRSSHSTSKLPKLPKLPKLRHAESFTYISIYFAFSASKIIFVSEDGGRISSSFQCLAVALHSHQHEAPDMKASSHSLTSFRFLASSYGILPPAKGVYLEAAELGSRRALGHPSGGGTRPEPIRLLHFTSPDLRSSIILPNSSWRLDGMQLFGKSPGRR